MRLITLIAISTALLGAASAARLNSEGHYQKIAAKKYNGQTEVSMQDGMRYEIVTVTHAIEVDFAEKWAEALGLCLNYAFQSNKRAGILQIPEKKTDEKHLNRVQSIIAH